MANSICVNVVMLTMDDTHAGDVQGCVGDSAFVS
jgi:hypothetical protein